MSDSISVEKLIEDLDKEVKIDFENKTPRIICARADQYYNLAQKRITGKDITLAYAFFSRWIQCAEWLKAQKCVDKKTIGHFYPESKIKEVRSIISKIIIILKNQHQLKIPNSTDNITNQMSDVNKYFNNDLRLLYSLTEVITDISCEELFDMVNSLDDNTENRLLIIDVRSSEEFWRARLAFEEIVIHIPEDEINDTYMPCAYRCVISELNGHEAVKRFTKRSSKYTDLIVLVDSNSAADTLDPNSAIAKLKKCLMKNDRVTDIKRIAVLNSGFELWKKLYPEYVLTNLSITNNLPKCSTFHSNVDGSPVMVNSTHEMSDDVWF